MNEDSPPETPPAFSFVPSRSRFRVTVVEPTGEQHATIIQQPPQPQPQNPNTPPRTRKLSSWVPMVRTFVMIRLC